MGRQYSTSVFEKMGYLQSDKSIATRKQKDVLRQIKSNHNNKISTKTRRQVLKKLRASKNAACNRREGITYESGFALNEVLNFIPHPKVSTQEKVDLQSCKVLIYDLETTGTALQDEIVQIAVEAFTDTRSFNAYIIPSKPISKTASQITGLRVLQGELYLYKNRVESVSARVACQQFLKYLRSFKCPLILVAHNGFTFDNPRITRLMQQCQLYDEFSSIVKGFADSLRIFRQILPERKKRKGKFSVNGLLHDYLPKENSQSLHNAIDDVRVLKKLIRKIMKSETVIKKYAKSISEINAEKELKATKTTNKASLQQYKDKLSSRIINKMVEAGITQHVMQLAFKNNGKEGLRVLFSENVNGKPRITKNKNILETIYSLFPSD